MPHRHAAANGAAWYGYKETEIMSNDKVETVCNTDLVATNDEPKIERDPNGLPTAVGTATVRPWTSDFCLPSIRYREPSVPKIKRH